MFDLEKAVLTWKEALLTREAIGPVDSDELESHLRDEVVTLSRTGLTTEEAFLIAVKRLGEAGTLSEEYRKVQGLVWKGWSAQRNEVPAAVLLAALAAVLSLIPTFFGIRPFNGPMVDFLTYFRWAGFFFAVPTAMLFFLKNRTRPGGFLIPWLLTAVAFVLTLFLPLVPPYQTAVLTGLHLPVLLWFGVLTAYLGTESTPENRMNFVRVTGEAILYTFLILIGGVALIVLVIAAFETIGVNVVSFCRDTLAPAGFFAAPVVGMFLADSKKGVVENLAPLLAKIFSPLFLAALLLFLAVGFGRGGNPFADRDSLGIADLVLGFTLALVVFAVSARKATQAPTTSDVLLFGLIGVSLVIDGVALSAIAWRIGSFGISPNKLALLGANLLLLANLTTLAWRYLVFFRKKKEFGSLIRAQTGFLPVYAAWAGVVALIFPFVFG